MNSRAGIDGICRGEVAPCPFIDGAVWLRARLGVLHVLHQPLAEYRCHRRRLSPRGRGRLAFYDAHRHRPASYGGVAGTCGGVSVEEPMDRLVHRALRNGRTVLAARGVDSDKDGTD